MELKNSKAIVTGAASGLGEATARMLVQQGGQVALIDLNRERGEKLQSELGGASVFMAASVTDEADMDKVAAAVKEAFGAVNVVVNCAGVGKSAKIVGKDSRMPLEDFSRIVQVNLVGTFNVIRATLPFLMENSPGEDGERGVYINTSSIAAFDGQVGQAAYSASKGGILSMGITLAREFADNGIRVMTILPGVMDTPLLAGLPEKARERLNKQVPFPSRLGKPSEFAQLAGNIVTNPYLNGESIRLDGALRMGFGRA